MKALIGVLVLSFSYQNHATASCTQSLELKSPFETRVAALIGRPTIFGLKELIVQSFFRKNGRLQNFSSDHKPRSLLLDSAQTWEPWLHMSLLDPGTYVVTAFGGYYKKNVKFNLTTSKFYNKSEFVIDSLSYEYGELVAIIRRDSFARQYDRSTKYQELTVRFDARGRPIFLRIRNGNSKAFSYFWESLDIVIPEQAVVEKRVYLGNESPTFTW